MTAKAVANACPAIAPVATPHGDWPQAKVHKASNSLETMTRASVETTGLRVVMRVSVFGHTMSRDAK